MSSLLLTRTLTPPQFLWTINATKRSGEEPTAGCSAEKQAGSKKSDTLLSASVSQFKELKDDPIISPQALHSRGPLKSVTRKTKLYPSKTQRMESLCLKSGVG